jgi:toluene monooxygenase electron transfer component
MAHIEIPAAKTSFECPEDDTILRAGLRAGLGMAYECNVGSCGNCRFELIEGQVESIYPEAPGLQERDKQRNRHLGCQTRPLGDIKIKVPMRDDYKARIKPARTNGELVAIEDITHDIREFRFRLDAPNPFLPGQYGLIGIPDVHGARAYSMCNVTAGGEEWHFQIKRVPNGKGTTALFENGMKGERVALDGPYGNAYLREDAPRDILCIAGGSGLSPMISIARAVSASKALAGRNLHFVYGCRNTRDLAGEAILRELPGFGTTMFYHAALSHATPDENWTGWTGFAHEAAREVVESRLPEHEIYFAGPPAMTEAVMRLAIADKVPLTQLHYDRFY